MNEYVPAATAAITAAICYLAAVDAYHKRRRWIPFAVIFIIWIAKLLYSDGTNVPLWLQSARDLGIGFLILANMGKRKTERK